MLDALKKAAHNIGTTSKKVCIAILTKLEIVIVKLIAKLGGSIEEHIEELGEILVQKIEDLDGMTIAELRVYAKKLGISLEGKRVKGEIIEIIKKNINQ